MSLITKGEFEHFLTKQLEHIQRGLTIKAKRRIGDAWRAVIDQMYRDRTDDMTYGNLSRIITECAEDIQSLTNTLKDEPTK
jgi:hypothetical protein